MTEVPPPIRCPAASRPSRTAAGRKCYIAECKPSEVMVRSASARQDVRAAVYFAFTQIPIGGRTITTGSRTMNDTTVPINWLISYTSWALAALTLASAWLVTLVADQQVGAMLGITALCFSAIAAVSQIRCYVVRLCSLLRAMQVERELNTELHSLH